MPHYVSHDTITIWEYFFINELCEQKHVDQMRVILTSHDERLHEGYINTASDKSFIIITGHNKMQTKGLLFLWGILASCLVFFANGSTLPSHEEIKAKFQESRFLDTPHFDGPTEQEWIEMITATLPRNSLPKYLTEQDYIFTVNEIGEFTTTEGVKGLWNSTKHIFYKVSDSSAWRYILSFQWQKVGDSYHETTTGLVTLFTFLQKGYVSSHEIFGMKYVENNNILEQTENFQGYGQGASEYLSEDKLSFDDYAIVLVNRSNVLSITDEEYGGFITVHGDMYDLAGEMFKNSLPFSNVDVVSLPKNREDLASLLRATKASTPHVTTTTATVVGEQTLGPEGYYKGDIEAVTSVFPDRSFNTTATIQASYANGQNETHLLIRDLIYINTPFLR
ncbi:uncharacterized protein [Palaemon carinicauda]|uniref:uncharacterized protein n=1 Tax=Palaemon carinicauda TaxID=392227 RepID=UPI0035B68551